MAKLALLDYLGQSRRIMLKIPLKSGETQSIHATGQIKDLERRTFVVDLLDHKVPSGDTIDFRERCTVSLHGEGPSLSMFATIEEVLGDRKLLLVGTDFAPHVAKRHTFRVEADIPVQYRHYYREREAFRSTRSLDISSGGIRLLCPEEIQAGAFLTLNISVPGPNARNVFCTVQVVWTTQRPDKERIAGCKFLDLEEASEDAIIGYCFEKQRELMKEMVQVSDSGKSKG